MDFEHDSPSVPEEPAPSEPAKGGKRKWTRWIGVGIAALVLILGVASLVSAMARRSAEAKAAEIDALKQTIAEEEDRLEGLQSDYDAAVKALEAKQAEYDDAREKADAGIVASSAAGQQSLDELKAASDKARSDYSAALEAYDKAVDAAEQTVAGYDEAKAAMARLEPFLSYATAYQQFTSGAADALPGYDPGEDAPDPQAWYTQVVLPAAEQKDISLPANVTEFPAAIQALTADPAAKVKAYEDALAAVKEAEKKLEEANAAQEAADKAYADGKEAQKTSEAWLSECEEEIDRLQRRVDDLKDSIDELTETLEGHRAELKALEGE